MEIIDLIDLIVTKIILTVTDYGYILTCCPPATSFPRSRARQLKYLQANFVLSANPRER